MPLEDFAQRISKLQAFDFGQELQTIVAENAEKITPYILEQLASGKDGNDQPNKIFGRNGYSPKTVEIKEVNGQGLGAVTDRITNYMSGDFYESLKTEVEGQVFEADSDVSYFGDIRLYSSPELLEVNEENRLDFAEKVTLPAIKESLQAKTGLIITNGGNGTDN